MSDETDDILADSEFFEALRESIEQADAGNIIPWEVCNKIRKP